MGDLRVLRQDALGRLEMTSTTRWLSPVASRPADYPAELPFLSDRGCLLSRSGNGDSELFSVLWPASEMWPADFLRQPRERTDRTFAWPPLASGALPDEVSTVFDLVCESSCEAGWSRGKGSGAFRGNPAVALQSGTAYFEKGPRGRLVTETAAGVTLQEGCPAQEAARDSA